MDIIKAVEKPRRYAEEAASILGIPSESFQCSLNCTTNERSICLE